MATAGLLGKSLAPRIARMHEHTLYKLDRSRRYAHLDPILDGTVKPHLVRRAWDETVRVVASIQARTASPSLILHRLGSYARQHSVHQALNEIGRVDRTVHILRTIDEEEYRRRQGRELNKDEAAHDFSRFLFFGKQGELQGRSFDDQFRSFSSLGVLHNAVVAWNIIRVGQLVEQLRAEGHTIDDATLALTTPLMHKHLALRGPHEPFRLICVPTDCDGPRAGIDQPERGSGPTNFRSKTGYAADVHHNNINDGCLAARFAGHAPFAEPGANANRATRHSADDA